MVGQLEIVSSILYIQMLFMTIEGDLKDLRSEEPCIPRALGVRVKEIAGEIGVLVTPSRFIVVFLLLAISQSILIVSLAFTHSVELAAVTVVPATIMSVAAFSMVEGGVEYSPDKIKKRIVAYTILFVISFGIASLSYMDSGSVAVIIVGSISWGLAWQQVLFGDAGYFS
jgi:hypothetical protein